MIKNWLIRTKNNHILGPVSKEKVKELISNGSIKGDDEVCSGNGYWFFIREEDLVQKYVFGDEPQGFNPVSEAESVKCKPQQIEEKVTLPSDENLEYPDMDSDGGSETEDMTLVGNLNLSALNAAGQLPQAPDHQDDKQIEEQEEEPQDIPQIDAGNVNQYQDISLANSAPVDEELIKNKKFQTHSSAEAEVIDLNTVKKKKKVAVAQSKSFLSENVLYILILVFFSLAVSAFYFRKRIIKNFIETSSISSVISVAHAQVPDDSNGKKKSLI